MTVIIGIDPHKATHMAVAIDGDERSIARFEVRAQRNQTVRLLAWAALFPDRRWAIESADGLGKLLAQQLVAAGEDVVDVPPTLSARVRLRFCEGWEERRQRRVVDRDRGSASLRVARSAR